VQGNIIWKWFILRSQLFQVIFWHGYHQYVCSFAALYQLQEGGGELLLSDGGGDPLLPLLEGALGLHAAC
jgi:hypothetical protein